MHIVDEITDAIYKKAPVNADYAIAFAILQLASAVENAGVRVAESIEGVDSAIGGHLSNSISGSSDAVAHAIDNFAGVYDAAA